MIVSEPVSLQDTYPGETVGASTRGGWRPIFDEYFMVIDWMCPLHGRIWACYSGKMVCQSCGLQVKEYPDPKLLKERDRRDKIRAWIEFSDEVWNDGERAGLGSERPGLGSNRGQHRKEDQHKTSSELRPNQETTVPRRFRASTQLGRSNKKR